ncbi:hypothetical protein ACEWY4_027718 [Coilia grayii]|uniref:Uncharacterized protein n=1 Tax=Coilia grayii TaxID=363190 RepID=A0ABD1IPB4_9TELE
MFAILSLVSSQGAMAARYPWWKSLTARKKRDSPVQKDLDPDNTAESALDSSTPAVDPRENTSLISDDTYDDSQEESAFNENTSRRNLRVSRSGRFKEKRRIRVNLPENNNFYETSTAVAK